MDGYEQLCISAGQLKVLAGSADSNDRVMAATEIQTLAESKRVASLEIDFVVMCVPESSDGSNLDKAVRCFSMAAGQICNCVVPVDKPYGAYLGTVVKAQMGSSLVGRLVLLSEDGQLLWQDEPSEVRAVLRTLADDINDKVLIATVAALEALIVADDGNLSGFAIEELYRLVLRGAVPDLEVIAEAFEVIRLAAEHGSKQAVDVFVESLWNDAYKVRLFAVVGLEAPAKAGDKRALAGLLRSIGDVDPQVRQAALDGLGSTLSAMEQGSEAARAVLAANTDTLLKMLELDRHICAEVVVALGAAAGNGHALALAKLLHLARESDEEVACSAVRGLGVAAMQGSAKILEALASLAETTEDAGIRLQAVGSMGAMVQDGHIDTVAGLARIAANIDDPNVFVRLEAVKGLGLAVAAASETATVALLELMKSQNIMIRRAAAEHIATIVSTATVLELFSLESRGLVAAVIACQSDADVMIRRAAISCFSALSEKGHTMAEISLVLAVKDSDEHVRRVAARSLGQLAEAYNAEAAGAVLACAKDDSSLVRAEVAACAVVLAELGNEKAMELLPVFEEDSSVLVRVAAQPGTSITTDVGDAVSMVRYSYEASRLVHHGLGAAAVPMLQAVVEPGVVVAEVPNILNAERAITCVVQSKLDITFGGHSSGGTA